LYPIKTAVMVPMVTRIIASSRKLSFLFFFNNSKTIPQERFKGSGFNVQG